MSWNRFGFSPYVPVGQRLEIGQQAALALANKENRSPQPVKPNGREIAVNFWGKAWCEHLQSMRDLENRLDRGRRYLGNGSVVDLVITACLVKSLVAGSSTYKVEIKVKPLPGDAWERIKRDARTSVRSVMDLLAGKIDDTLIRLLTDPQKGIFPKPDEIDFACSCPDGAYVCKHVAAAFYGVGTLLDTRPDLLFLIRDVDSSELVGLEAVASSLGDSLDAKSSLEEMNLEELFGIELEKDPLPTPPQAPPIIKRKKKPLSDDLPKTKTMDKPGPVGKAKSAKAKSASPPKPPKKALIKPAPKSKPSTTTSKARNSKSEIQKDTKKPKKELNDKSKIKPKPINRLKKTEK
jgi:uncharacterized Zn finger protein